jgi:hypothetical protein
MNVELDRRFSHLRIDMISGVVSYTTLMSEVLSAMFETEGESPD